MKTNVTIFTHDQILRKFYSGLTDWQIKEICELTGNGKSVWVLESEPFVAYDYITYGEGGQLTSGTHQEFMDFASKGFVVEDEEPNYN